MEVTKIDALYLDRFISLTLEWQSANPVMKVLISAGRESREMPVDEFDNRRNPNGYQGTVTVQLQADSHYPQTTIPYQIQLEDDLRQKSAVFSGKVPVTAAQAQNMPQREDTWGHSNIKAGQGQGQPLQAGGKPVDMIDKLLVVIDRFDIAPSMDAIKVNLLSPDAVSFSSKANDDKGLLEVRFRVYGVQGNLVGFQSLINLGKSWQGSSQSFELGGGTFQVVAQAVDSSGNTSKEQRSSFILNGTPRELPPLQEPPFFPPIPLSTQTGSAPLLPNEQPMIQQNLSPYPEQMMPPQTVPYTNPAPNYPPAQMSPYQQPQPTYQAPPVLPPPLPNDPGYGTTNQQQFR